MKILVCLKQIIDPEIPARDFRVDSSGQSADAQGANLVTNIFCENALETALQLQEVNDGAEITVMSLGHESADDTLRKALAMKADHAVRVDGSPVVGPDADYTSRVIAKAIEHLGGFDLVLLGREAGDWGMGQTGAFLAERLGLPLVSFVDEIVLEGGEALMRRQSDDGWEKFKVRLPAVATITNSDDNLPRIPKTRDIMKSSRKPISVLSLQDLGFCEDQTKGEATGVRVASLVVPSEKPPCEFVNGETLDARVEELASRMATIVKQA